MIGRPSTRTFLDIVNKNLLPNCPINQQDILAANEIFGPDVGSLKGKTVRQSADHVNVNMVDIPATIMSHYCDVLIGGDIMFVNTLPFLVTISRGVKFGTSEMLGNQKGKTILDAIKHVITVYIQRGFRITHLMMDGQFETQRADLADLKITLNTVSNDEHVPEIERHIRTIKERTRCVYNTLPFTKMPSRMIIEMVYVSNF